MVRGFIAPVIVLAVPIAGWFACLPNEPAIIEGPPSSDAGTDSGQEPEPEIDAGRCATGVDAGGTFMNPTLIFSTSSAADRRGAFLSRNEKTLYFASAEAPFRGVRYPWRLHRAVRNDRRQPFTNSEELNVVNQYASQDSPRLTYDGDTLVFAATTASDSKPHLYFAVRTPPSLDFGPPDPLKLFTEGGQSESHPFLRMDATGIGDLWFARCPASSTNDCTTSDAGGSTGLYRAAISNWKFKEENTIGSPEEVVEVNDLSANEHAPVVSGDGLEIFFERNGRIFRAWRGSTSGNSKNFREVNQVRELSERLGVEAPNWLSEDNCRLYFQSQKGDTSSGAPVVVDLYMATRSPP